MLLNDIKNRFLYDLGLIGTNDIRIINELISKGVVLRPAINGIGGYPGKFEIEHGLIKKLRISNIDYHLDYLDEEIFELISELNFLEVLIITTGRISKLPDCISKLTRLRELHINFQNLKEFPAVVTKLKNLRFLEFSHNQIKKIPDNIFSLQYLETLMLPENIIETIPDTISKLTNLEYVTLYNNKIQKVTPELFNISNLVSIDLSNNKISEIPKNISNLINLKGISFANRTFYEDYKKNGIIDPDYNNNTISFIPIEMKSLYNLETFLLDNNPILKSIENDKYNSLNAKEKVDYLIKYQNNFIISQKEKIFREVKYIISEEDATMLRELIESSKNDTSKNREFINKVDDLNNIYGFGKNITEIIRLFTQLF